MAGLIYELKIYKKIGSKRIKAIMDETNLIPNDDTSSCM